MRSELFTVGNMEQKSTLAVRPLFHHRDDTSFDHIVAGFLAVRLEVDLNSWLKKCEVDVSWPGIDSITGSL